MLCLIFSVKIRTMFNVSLVKNLKKKLISILQNDTFDIVQLETLYISPPFIETIRENSKAKIVLRAHNIEHLIWERVAEISSNPLKNST